MKALLIGATGATGKDLTELLLADNSFDEIHIFVRKPLTSDNPKLKVHTVSFDDITSWADQLNGDVLFSALGTTVKDAGGQAAQWKVDYTYQLEVAKHARANGVSNIVLVSAVGANAKSYVFYLRMKGQLEDEIKMLKFNSTVIVRPPSLIRKNTTRLSEKISLPILKFFNALGLFKSMAPMSTETVAKAMIAATKNNKKGVSILENSSLRMMQ